MGDALGKVARLTGDIDPTAKAANEFAKDSGLDFGLLSGIDRDKAFKADHAKKTAAFEKQREQQKQESVFQKKKEVSRTTPKAQTQSLLTRTI
ncbi:hypothetical protein N9878_00710 [bacterium]|nr:hypothetical protein [bacterium]